MSVEGEGRPSSGDESKAEELEREHEELFHELRSLIPGAEVLFAFLLTIAFSNRFAEVTPLQQRVYFATFLCAGIALVLLLAPAVYHRVRFRQRDKENMMRYANREALAASVFVVLSIGGTVFLITDLLYSAEWASVAAGVVAGLAAALWWVLPLWGRLTDDRGETAVSRCLATRERARPTRSRARSLARGRESG